ncbi:all-trans-retinol 13,14-reductase-like [Carcharodon carcharias]|uniref:all-trans-retinol 13,14-reductase-like n=1 Tax=Carcharodon carcharias TaxID=13397 RepID=UPI001B7EDC14|nr:all-trans-retinol 13,14-reductase-like [Carcharodon carcharias]
MWLYAGLLLVLYFLVRVYRRTFRRSPPAPNPFAGDTRRPPEPLVTDQEARKRVIHKGFTANKVPENLDAIVIGSGIGGLSAAAILAKAGKCVLVLEQHDQAGGCCHTFIKKGFEFDVGIHYVGELYERSFLRTLVDQITDGQLEWVKMDDCFDNVILGDPQTRRTYGLYGGKQNYQDCLKRQFPEETEAIDKFLELVEMISRKTPLLIMIKMIPLQLARFLIKTGIIHWISSIFKAASTPLSEVTNKLTKNKDLRAVMSYVCGDYGVMPKDASFMMHALIIQHYKGGAWYPKGGASEIAFHIIPIIKKSGGDVLMRAPVQRILINQDSQAYGVTVRKGEEEINLFAPIVISDAGIINTYEKLLPRELQSKPVIQAQLSMVQHGIGGFSVFVGLNGSKEELGLKASNYWFFQENNLDELFNKYLTLSKEDAIEGCPLMFVSFPSAKDPSWNDRYAGKSSMVIVTLARFEWFEEWKDQRVKKRGDDYENLKMDIAKRLIDQVTEYFPQLKDKIEYIRVGSPLTNQFYIAASCGEMYGLNHDVSRFAPEVIASFRAKTPVKNLYLTGQDIFSCGFMGAINGGVICASGVLQRNLYTDIINLKKKIKKAKAKKEA